MAPEDHLDIDGLRNVAPDDPRNDGNDAPGPARRFLAVWFQCCHAYGRMYRNGAGTRYEGRCPRCGATVHALIGPGGTSQRVFRAR